MFSIEGFHIYKIKEHPSERRGTYRRGDSHPYWKLMTKLTKRKGKQLFTVKRMFFDEVEGMVEGNLLQVISSPDFKISKALQTLAKDSDWCLLHTRNNIGITVTILKQYTSKASWFILFVMK
ncbi:Heme oxygenase HutZ [Frankliniella fusca]|uniref:Heme oxygenase HutZ n=1 Tax=Frankliniella fusca TaxID=407009 RepID=A0AAE1LTN8_9NEOP|nr:Heme oxygenase HutZ [Frankliniella fusca]